jgi:hypothetical protein
MSSAADTAIVRQAQANLPDRVKGAVQLDNYTTSENFDLFGYELSGVLDDIILIKYLDCSDDGQEILKNGIFVPINATTFTWRIGEVILAGPNCQLVKKGSVVCFPNDKGIQVGNLEVTDVGKLKNSCFINEDRIFGICKPSK